MFTGIRTRSAKSVVAPLFLVRVPESWPTAFRWPLRSTNLITLYLPAKVAPLLGVAGDLAGLQRPELVGDALGRGGLGTATAHQGDDSEGQRRRQHAGVVGEATEGGCRTGVHREPLKCIDGRVTMRTAVGRRHDAADRDIWPGSPPTAASCARTQGRPRAHLPSGQAATGVQLQVLRKSFASSRAQPGSRRRRTPCPGSRSSARVPRRGVALRAPPDWCGSTRARRPRARSCSPASAATPPRPSAWTPPASPLLVMGGVTHLSLSPPRRRAPGGAPGRAGLHPRRPARPARELAGESWHRPSWSASRARRPSGADPARPAVAARRPGPPRPAARAPGGGKSGTSRPRSSRSRRNASSVAACWKSPQRPRPARSPYRPSTQSHRLPSPLQRGQHRHVLRVEPARPRRTSAAVPPRWRPPGGGTRSRPRWSARTPAP